MATAVDLRFVCRGILLTPGKQGSHGGRHQFGLQILDTWSFPVLLDMAVGQNPVPLVNIKIGGNQMDVHPPHNGIATAYAPWAHDCPLSPPRAVHGANHLVGNACRVRSEAGHRTHLRAKSASFEISGRSALATEATNTILGIHAESEWMSCTLANIETACQFYGRIKIFMFPCFRIRTVTCMYLCQRKLDVRRIRVYLFV